jgi:hypothetical protein
MKMNKVRVRHAVKLLPDAEPVQGRDIHRDDEQQRNEETKTVSLRFFVTSL